MTSSFPDLEILVVFNPESLVSIASSSRARKILAISRLLVVKETTTRIIVFSLLFFDFVISYVNIFVVLLKAKLAVEVVMVAHSVVDIFHAPSSVRLRQMHVVDTIYDDYLAQ